MKIIFRLVFLGMVLSLSLCEGTTNTEMITKLKGFKDDSTVDHIARNLRNELLEKVDKSISAFEEQLTRLKAKTTSKIIKLEGIINKVLPKMTKKVDQKLQRLKSMGNLAI